MLNRRLILVAALDLLEDVGPHLLTMRTLAKRLDVTATAIYYHFDGREELLEAIVDMVCEDVVADVTQEGDWPDRLRSLLTRMVDHLADHPKAAAWVVVEYPRRPPVLRIHEAILGILHDARFPPDAALHIRGAVLRYCMGHLILAGTASDISWRRLPESFEHFRAVGPAQERFDSNEQFAMGLSALLTGLAASSSLQPGPDTCGPTASP